MIADVGRTLIVTGDERVRWRAWLRRERGDQIEVESAFCEEARGNLAELSGAPERPAGPLFA